MSRTSTEELKELVEKLELYLPSYLTAIEKSKLSKLLQDFQNSMDNIYEDSYQKESILWQGDGIGDMEFVQMPSEVIKKGSVMLLSNTCDMSMDNPRTINQIATMYAPILSISKIKETFFTYSKEDEEKKKTIFENFYNNVKKQEIFNLYYLPVGFGIKEESVAFLDRPNHCSASYVNNQVFESKKPKLFSLNQIGFYFLLFKLSIHFSRFGEGVHRSV